MDPKTSHGTDLSEAVQFLRLAHPKGPWFVCCMQEREDSPNPTVTSRMFSEAELDQIEPWLAARNGKCNLYWQINKLVGQPKSHDGYSTPKASMHHVSEVVRFHVDLDARKDLDREKERALLLRCITDEALLKKYGLPGLPTFITDSGNGYWAFWDIEPIIAIAGNDEERRRTEAELIGRQNRWIKEQLNAALAEIDPDSDSAWDPADSCHNVDRISRLPGTLNLPNAKKRAVGYVAVPSGLVEYRPSRIYKRDQFGTSKVSSLSSTSTQKQRDEVHIGELIRTLPGNHEPYDIGQALKAAYPAIAEKTLELIILGNYLHADGADNIGKGGSPESVNRSVAHYRVNRHLQHIGVPLEVILGILCDERLPISDHAIAPEDDNGKKGKRRSGRELINFNKGQISKCFLSLKKEREEAEAAAAADALKPKGQAKFTDDAGTTGSGDETGAADGVVHNAAGGASKVPETPEEVLRYLNDKHAVLLQEGGKTKVLCWEKSELDHGRETPVLQSFEDFRNRYMNKVVQVGVNAAGAPILKPWGKFWLEHRGRRQYYALRFLPGQGEAVDGYLNLWRGWAVPPVAGDWSLMKAHVHNVLANGNAEYAAYILKWAAWAVQNPDQPAEVALVFKGRKGTGKGIFARTLKAMFGQHGLQITSPMQLTGRFNAHLRDCCLLFADEAIMPDDKKSENVLRALITEPEIAVERKQVDVTAARNRLHIVMASNDDWVVPTSIDERRFAIFEVSSQHMQNEEYFKAITDQLNAGGLAAMLHELLAMDLDGWHPRRGIPQTEALASQKEESLSPADQFILATIEEGSLPGAAIPHRLNSVFSRDIGRTIGLYTLMRASSPFLRNQSDHKLGRMLKKWGAKRVTTGKHRGWEMPPLANMRQEWDEKFWKCVWSGETEWINQPNGDAPQWERVPDYEDAF